MAISIDKDTQLCISLASRPGNFGNRFHNFLYQQLGLNFVYKSVGTQDLEGAVRGIRALGIRGSAVSMPFKEAVMPLLDELDAAAREVGAVNTIVNDGGKLKGFNTDLIAVRELLAASGLKRGTRAGLLGSGGMAKAIALALHEQGLKVDLISRNEKTGRALAQQYGFEWRDTLAGTYEALINATPIGMSPDPSDRIPFTREQTEHAKWIMDSVVTPPETSWVKLGKQLGKRVVSGLDITVIQAREQFRLYTGVTPSADLLIRALALSSASTDKR
jgi:shikimate dehydrogenase